MQLFVLQLTTGISCMFLLDRWLLWCFGCVAFGCELWMGSFPQDTFWDSQNQSFRYRKGRNALVRNKQGQISSPNRLSPCGEDAEGNPCEYEGLLPGRPGTAFSSSWL